MNKNIPDENVTSAINEAKQIDVTKVNEWLSLGIEAARGAKGQIITPIVGISGSGKSAAVNYLMGSKLVKVKKGLLRLVKLVDGEKEYAKIGEDILKSETMVPNIIKTPASYGFSICDCPGFNGTRGKVELICAMLANQLALRHATQVHGLMVVVEKDAFNAERSAGLRHLFTLINGMLRNPKLFTRSMYFIITKVDEEDTKEDVVATLKACRKELTESLAAHKPDDQSIDKQLATEQIAALDLILANHANIILLNPFDGGKSREEIINRLRVTMPIPKEQFGFADTSQTKDEFYKFVFTIANDGMKKIDDYHDLFKERQELKNQIKHEESIIDEKNKKIEEIEKEIATVSIVNLGQQRVDKLNQVIHAIKLEIERHKNNIEKITEEISKKTEQRNQTYQAIIADEPYYNILNRIAGIFPFTSESPVRQFLKAHQQLISISQSASVMATNCAFVQPAAGAHNQHASSAPTATLSS